MYLFAKEADLSKGLGSSNLPVSARTKQERIYAPFLLGGDEKVLDALSWEIRKAFRYL